MNVAIGLDYTSRISPAALLAAGVTVVCRYIAPQAWKVISKAEYDELLAAHIAVFLNWESSATDWLRGLAGGSVDATSAVAMAKALGYPAGSIIIGSCDFDITQAQADSVGHDYAVGFQAVLRRGGYRAGVYGPKRALDIGQRLGFAFGWQSMSTGYYGNAALHPFANLRQIGYRTVGGVVADWNEIIRLDNPPEEPMFVALAGDGTVYLCDGMHSRALSGSQYGDLKTLVAEGLIPLTNRVDAPRKGFYAGAFGVPDSTVDVAALAATLKPLLPAGATIDVGALAVALAAHLPAHITLTGTVTE